jgi:hypothetical protein
MMAEALAPHRQREILQRAPLGDARVVDGPVERAAVSGDLRGDGVHLGLIGHIEQYRSDPAGTAAAQFLRLRLFADTGIDTVAEVIQVQRARLPMPVEAPVA